MKYPAIEAYRYYNESPETGDFYREVIAGFSQQPRSIPPKYFYDEEGSRLFESICEQPEYYLTRTEIMLLEKHGHSVTVAVNGKQAVELFEQDSFDIVLMDLQMPVMNGLEATRLIREREASDCGKKAEIQKLETRNLSKIPRGKETLETGGKQEHVSNVEHPNLNIQSSIVNRQLHTPIIAMTAHAMMSDRKKCLSAGMDDYISKPFNQDKILKVFQKLFGEKKLSESLKDESTQKVITEKEGSQQLSNDYPVQGNKVGIPVIDQSVLNSLRDLQMPGKPDILKRVISAYLSSTAPLLVTLKEAYSAKDIEGTQNSAHTLKSSSANVGAIKLSELCKELEIGCRNNTLENAAFLISSIESEVTLVTDALNKEIHST